MYIEKVKEFHEVFEHPINDNSLEIRQLRIKLLFEELSELTEASDVKGTLLSLCDTYVKDNIQDDIKDGNKVDRIEELDALCDLQYILSGSVLTYGFHEVFDQAFSDVHDSNMSKLCSNEKEVEDTIASYNEKQVEVYSVAKNDKFIIKRKVDGKILKNIYYSQVELEKYIK